jgi:hypothetical protein
MRKPFEQELHDLYDAPAKAAIATYMERRFGVTVESNPDQYGVDLLVSENGRLIGTIEVEVRQWHPCPYPTIHIPERKRKFFSKNSLFFALTKTMTHAYWIEMKDIEQYPVKEISNYKVHSGELFFDVPTDKFGYVDLNEHN